MGVSPTSRGPGTRDANATGKLADTRVEGGALFIVVGHRGDSPISEFQTMVRAIGRTILTSCWFLMK